MATKIFCDGCGKEMNDGYALPTGLVGSVSVNVTLTSPVVGGADICKHCVIDAFKKLDDRAMEMPEYGVPWEPTEAVLAAGTRTAEKYAAGGADIKIALHHAWRTMFDEAVRMLPPAYGKGGATRGPLDDRLRVQLDRPAWCWQFLPVEPMEAMIEAGERYLSEPRMGEPHRSIAVRLWHAMREAAPKKP